MPGPDGSGSMLEAIILSSIDAVMGMTLDGIVTLWNPAAERMYGYSAEEMVGSPVARLVPEERLGELRDVLARLSRGERVANLETVRVRKDHTRLDVSLNVAPICDSSGTVIAAATIARDITARKRRETVEAEHTFQELLEAAPDPVVITDQNGHIRIVNTETERKFGYARSELLGKPVEMLVPERFRSGHVRQRQGYQQAPHTRPMGVGLQLFAQRSDGTEFPVEVSLSPLRRADGTLLITSIVRDITERKQTETRLQEAAAELARSNQELQQFAYIASHDLQEPLRMVASFTQLLARRYQGKLDPDADEIIQFAVDGARRMQALINDLLIYSRVGTQFHRDPVDVQALVKEALLDVRSSAESAGARVEVGDLPVVPGDPVQLRQLFQNLISNAVKFHGAEPPVVHISAERQGSEWLFAVRDNGIGIEPQYASRVFAIFQRLHTAAEYPGTGIGLAICKKVVERHKGRIWFESEVGKGTVFYFTLPAE